MTMTMTGIEAGNLQVRLMMRAMAMVMVMIYFSISSETYLVFMVVAFWLQIAWGGWPEGLSRCSSGRVYAGFTYFLCPFLVSSIFVWLHSNAKINGSKCMSQPLRLSSSSIETSTNQLAISWTWRRLDTPNSK